MISVTVFCMECRKAKQLTVDKEGFERWHNGEVVQSALPYLSPEDRELLISGLCGKCFDQLFEEE